MSLLANPAPKRAGPGSETTAKPRWRLAHSIALVVCVAGVVICLLPAPAGSPPGLMRVAGVVCIAIGLWATAVLPEFFTALIFFFLAVTLAAAPPSVVFSGFYSSAAWMVFGGLVLALAVQATGLGARFARSMIGWLRGSYFVTVAGLILIGALLAFAIPSTSGRVVILLAIVLPFAERLGFRPGSNGYTGLTLATMAGTLYPSFAILPASVPSLGLVGAAESLYGIKLTYGEVFKLMFPVTGVVSIVLLPVIVTLLFPARMTRFEPPGDTTPMSDAERRVAVVLALALAFWITDFAHGISPAWVALGAAILLFLPGIGVMPPTALIEKLNIGPWFFVAGLIGMGALVTKSGVGALLGSWLFAVFPLAPGHDFANFVSVSAIGMGMGLVSTMPGSPAIMSALASQIAEATGWPLLTAVMAQGHTWSMVLFPYEFPPVVLTLFISRVRMSQMVRFLFVMTATVWLVTMPLQYLWWRTLGMFG